MFLLYNIKEKKGSVLYEKNNWYAHYFSDGVQYRG